MISLYDIWALPADTRRNLPCPWIAWVPVDGEPIPRGMRERLKTIDYPVAMSKYGQAQIEQAGFECDYIPLGIDCELFCPGDKDKAKAALGIPLDRYLVTVVAANKGYPMRKSWMEILQAFGQFYQDHSEAMLYLHTTGEPYGSQGRGIHFGQAIEALGLTKVPITFPDQGELAVGIPDEQMAMVYRASDVLLSPSMGEGFGLPICFLPGQLVYLDSGIKTIEKIEPMDRVLTHKGQYSTATYCESRHIADEEIISLDMVGLNEKIRLTKEHPVYALQPPYRRFISVRRALKRGLKPEWICAIDLTENDFLVIPLCLIKDTMDTVDLRCFTDVKETNGRLVSKYSNGSDNVVTFSDVAKVAEVSFTSVCRVLGGYDRPTNETIRQAVLEASKKLGWQSVKRSIPAQMSLNYRTGLLFGYYTAEGSISNTYTVEFASHRKEVGYRKIIGDILKEWGLSTNILHRKNSYSSRLYTCNKALAQVLKRTCGSSAPEKHIPMEWALHNKKFAQGFLTGFWWGDGHRLSGGFGYSTSSRRLAHELRRLLLGFGILATVHSHKRNKIKHEEFTITIEGKQSDRFATLIGVLPAKHSGRQGQYFIEHENYLYVPIRSIERETYTGLVYNLEVREDHSYVIHGFAMHNCEAQACGTPVITQDCSAMKELTINGRAIEPLQPFWVPQLGYWWQQASIERIVDALDRFYKLSDEAKEFMAGGGTEFIRTNYDWPVVMEQYWEPLLAKVQRELW